MRAALLFILALGVASPSPVADQNVMLKQIEDNIFKGESFNVDIVETAILQVLETIRNVMINGSDVIPPLDPFVINRIHVDENTLPIPGAFITINDLSVSGVSTFKVEELQFVMQSITRYRLNFNLTIPTVNVDTSGYDMFLEVFGGQVFGKGDMKLRIVNPRVNTYFVFGLRITINGIFLVIQDCHVSIGLDSFEPVITGMFGNEASSQFVSAFLRKLVTEMLEFFEDDITRILSTTVQTVGNQILRELDIGNLLPRSSAIPADTPEKY